MTNQKLKRIILHFSLSFCILIFAFCIWIPAYAAELRLVSQEQPPFGIAQEFQVDLMLDPEGEEINAVSASIVFSQELIEIAGIQDGSSILTLWIERPFLRENTISFSGVVPGGFIGILGPYEGAKPGKVLEIVLKTKDAGQGEIALRDAQVLLHDGQGTPASLELSNFQFPISKQIPISQFPMTETADTTPPETFTPEVASDPNVFDGKWFLVFATQDKDSGIDYYEVLENRKQKIENRKWKMAESPYLLKDQKLKSYVYVKVVDRAGNERIETLEPSQPLRWYDKWWIWGIIIVVSYVLWRALKRP